MQTKDQEENLKKLFLLAQKGDSEAYAEFLGILSGLLRGYLTKTMTLKSRSLEVVEDLVQDTLLEIHRKRHLHDSTRPILPWIYVIARHRLIDSIRADARRPELVEWVEKFDAEAFVEIPRLLEEEEGEHFLKRRVHIKNSL